MGYSHPMRCVRRDGLAGDRSARREPDAADLQGCVDGHDPHQFAKTTAFTGISRELAAGVDSMHRPPYALITRFPGIVTSLPNLVMGVEK